AFIDVIVDCLIRLRCSAVAEVCAPTSQHLIESISHLRPRLDVVGYQKVSHFLLDTRYALLGRTRTQIPAAILFETVWAERLSRPIEFHHRPLAEPSVRLSPHSAPIRQTRRPYRFANGRRDPTALQRAVQRTGPLGWCGL